MFSRYILAVGSVLWIFSSMLIFAQKNTMPSFLDARSQDRFGEKVREYNLFFEQLKAERIALDSTDKAPLRGTGYKAFKREEWFWSTRVDSVGNFPPTDLQFQEYQRMIQAEQRNPKSATVQQTTWTELGPSTSRGGYYGVGRVMRIVPEPGSTTRWWVCSAGGGIWRTENSGTTWIPVAHLSLPIMPTSDLAFDPNFAVNQTVYLATGDYVGSIGTNSVGVLRSTNGGQTWSNTGWTLAQSLNWRIARLLVHPTSGRIIAAANAMIRYSDDGGTTWADATGITFGTVFRDMTTKADDPSVMIAGTNDGRIFRSTNSGTSWTQVVQSSSATGRVAIATSPANPTIMYAVISNANTRGLHSVIRSVDAGVTWSAVYQPTTFAPTTPNLLSGTLQTQQTATSTGGQGEYDLCIGVSRTDANTVLVGGINLYRSINGGTSWSQVSHWFSTNSQPEVHADQHTLNYLPDGTLLIGNDGGVYSSANHGTSYTDRGQGLAITQFYRIANSATNPSRMLAGAQDNSSWLYNNSQWSAALATGDGMDQLISYANANEMYTSSYYGDISKSTNGGTSWSQWITSTGTDWNEAGDWVTPYVQHPASPTIYLVGKRNLWQYDGVAWSNKSNGQITPVSSTMTKVRYAPSDPTTIYVIKSGNLWVTVNDGTTWQQRARPGSDAMTDVDVHPLDPNRIWVTVGGFTANSRVFTSTNGGATWTNVSTNLPAVAMNSIGVQRDAPDRIYVGHDLGVHYRDNTSNGWQRLSSGLPNVPVTEVDQQISARKVRIATFGRGAWEIDAFTPAPLIASIAYPATIRSGEVFRVNGSDLNAVVSATLGGIPISVSSSSATMLTATIPNGVTSGSLVLTNAGGSATFFFGSTASVPLTMTLNPTGDITLPIGQAIPSRTLTFSASNLSSLTFSTLSSNTTLIPQSNITIVGTGSVRTLSITPAANQTGVSVITIIARDNQNQSVSVSFTIAITNNTPCNTTFTQESGNITQSANYASNFDCSWLIIPTSGNRVRLNFTSFSTENGFDFVTVYDGSSTTARQLGRFSGTSLPASLISSGNAMLVRFTTDESVSGEGWSASYETLAPTTILRVNTSTTTLPTIGGSTTLTLTTNVAWSVTSNQAWCTVSPTTGSNNGLLTITADNNTSAGSRTALVTITGGGTSQTVSVVQSGNSMSVSMPRALTTGLRVIPHPITETSSIEYTISQRQTVRLVLIDILGREIATVVNGSMPPGSYTVPFPRLYSRGMYILRIMTGNTVESVSVIIP